MQQYLTYLCADINETGQSLVLFLRVDQLYVLCFLFCRVYLCGQEKRRPASMQISLFISTRVHQWSGGTDGRTDTLLIGRSLSTGSAT